MAAGPFRARRSRRQRRARNAWRSRRDEARLGLHGEKTFGVFGPERGAAGSWLRRTGDRERGGVEQRANGAEAEARQRRCHVPAEQIDEQSRQQRAMHYKARIIFHAGDVAAIVMNAMAVEGERGV